MHIQAIPRQKHRNQAYSSSCVQVRCRLIEIEEEMSRLQAARTVDLVTWEQIYEREKAAADSLAEALAAAAAGP